MRIPFHRPIVENSVENILYDSVSSGWLTTGPKAREFESALQQYFQADHVVVVNSGTAALHLALAARGIGKGDQFIAPTYTFVATVEAGEYLGAHPMLVDSESDTLNLDLNRVEDVLRVNDNVRAIIPVHFAGQAVDMKQVFNLSNQYGLYVLEDAAHAIETVSNSGKVGNTKNAAAFSFYANKNITTGGEGGALATNDIDLADKVRKLSLHGMSKNGWKRFETGGKWAYDVSELGYKYNMTDIAASFGIDQLSHVEEWHRRRLRIVQQYCEGLEDIEGLILSSHKNGEIHAWHLYIVRIIPEMWQITRNELIEKINKRGIGTSVHYIPVHMHSYYAEKYGYEPSDYPVAKDLSETVITLPLYPALTNGQVTYIIKTINELWLENRC